MKYGFGIDLGGTTVKLAYFDEAGTMLHKWEIPTNTAENGKYILPDIAQAINKYMQENGIAYYKSNSRMDAETLKALADTAWTVGSSATIGEAESESSVIYARLTDALGNVSYISSDGVVVGDVAPVVEFVPDSETQLDENAHRYLEQAVITATVKVSLPKKISCVIPTQLSAPKSNCV